MTSGSKPGSNKWWQDLHDEAISTFVESTLKDSPTIAQAVARLDEARAQLGVDAAQRLPNVNASIGASRGKGMDVTGASSMGVSSATTASIGPTVSWEVDLFGRIRQSIEAANRRLDARTADADAVRLSLAADTVSNILTLRACSHTQDLLAEDIKSRSIELELIRQRVALGASAPVDEARSRSGLASARTSLAIRDEQCTLTVNALIALSGANAVTVHALIRAERPAPDLRSAALAPLPVVAVPKAVLEVPAQVLLKQPAVRAAESEAAAAWADIGVARAERMPQIDLAAALTGEWIRAAGTTLRYTAWSLGSSMSGSLFDGGAGISNVNVAEARYRAAVAALRRSVRKAIQDVENALAASISADARAALTKESVEAARMTFVATDVQWRAGAASLFELEDARRQLASVLGRSVTAERDRGLAWVALVRVSGNAISSSEGSTL